MTRNRVVVKNYLCFMRICCLSTMFGKLKKQIETISQKIGIYRFDQYFIEILVGVVAFFVYWKPISFDSGALSLFTVALNACNVFARGARRSIIRTKAFTLYSIKTARKGCRIRNVFKIVLPNEKRFKGNAKPVIRNAGFSRLMDNMTSRENVNNICVCTMIVGECLQ